MKEKANGQFASLKIVECPETNVILEERDGLEWLAETHSIWS
jgi:hypothetical protein